MHSASLSHRDASLYVLQCGEPPLQLEMGSAF
jgi:hypothetical protein